MQNENDIDNDILPPLRPVMLPRVLLVHQSSFADQGWTKVTFQGPVDPLQTTSQVLFEASKKFFDFPIEYKEAFKTQAGTEEGWNFVKGEKEFITLRTLEKTPKELVDAASAYWAEAGGFVNDTLGRIAESLGLPATALNVYSKPCISLGSERTATMLRIFRYESSGGEAARIVAEPHRDLGLISLVIGDKPGLEVWDRDTQFWFPIEKNFESPAGCFLVGRQLECLSNSRYVSGGHLVRSYPDKNLQEKTTSSSDPPNYRYSIVFVLRAHSPVPVDTNKLTNSITGQFKNALNGITADDMFKDIHQAHFNINTGIDERNKQRQKLAAKKAQV